jgi:NitT/TauT family transport system substrate-binding protein
MTGNDPADGRTESMKYLKVFCLALALVCLASSAAFAKEEFPINIAVEFTDHATSFYVAQHKGWFEQEGLKPTSYSYVTGMALASALGRGDIQAAYMCLLPAITAYANARVPIKVVAGLHRHGYGLAVDPAKIKTVADLEKPGIRIGCNKAGGPADAIIHKTIEKYNLDRDKILNKIQRMNPATQILAIRMGKLDAFFNCEHWPAMAEDAGFKMLLTSRTYGRICREAFSSSGRPHKKPSRDRQKAVKNNRQVIEWIKKNPGKLHPYSNNCGYGRQQLPSDAPEGAQKLK